MADAVATQILSDGPKFTVLKLTNVSDGSGEESVDEVLSISLSEVSSDVAHVRGTSEASRRRFRFW